MKFLFGLIGSFGMFAIIQASISPYVGFRSAQFLPTTTLLRSAQPTSAYVQSDQFGGNFAYSVSEGHGYQPLTQYLRSPYTSPVAVSYQYNQLPLTSLRQQYLIQHSPILSTLPQATVPLGQLSPAFSPVYQPALTPSFTPAYQPSVPTVIGGQVPVRPIEGNSEEQFDNRPTIDDDDSVSIESA